MTRLFRRLRLLAACSCFSLLAACDGDSGGSIPPPPPPTLTVTASPQTLSFEWADELASPDTAYYLQYSEDGGTRFAGGSAARATLSVSAHLEDWSNTFVRLAACRGTACSYSNAVALAPLTDNTYAVFNNPFPRSDNGFSRSVALSADGLTLAIAEPGNDARLAGMPDDCDAPSPTNCLRNSGAVLVYARRDNGWVLQATLKASNAGEEDYFGTGLAMSGSGQALVIGAPGEDSNLNGIRVVPAADTCNGVNPAEPCRAESGAAYVFKRNPNNSWSQRVFLKRETPEAGDIFGGRVGISNGFGPLVVAVSAAGEDSGGFGVTGVTPHDCAETLPHNCRIGSGAVLVFEENAEEAWRQAAFLKQQRNDPTASGLPDDNDIGFFGGNLVISGDGKTVAAVRIDRNDQFASVDFFRRGPTVWEEASHYWFNGMTSNGLSLSISNAGSRVAVGAPGYNEGGQAFLIAPDSSRIWQIESEIAPPADRTGTGFGQDVTLNDLGTRLAVGAPFHSGAGTGFGEHTQFSCAPADHADCAQWSGAVHLYEFQGNAWPLQRTIKSRHNELFFDEAATSTYGVPSADAFGSIVAMSGDGTTLAVSALSDDSGHAGIGGDASDGCELLPVSNCMPDSGTVFVY